VIIESIKKNTLTSLVSLASCGILLSPMAHANPVGGTVQAGTVNIQSVGPNTLQIDQLTQKAIIDWRSFSTNPQDIVRFLQPNSSAVILNRVVGQDPSILLGQLLANGNVFLLNPNGIVFGAGSITNVGGLLASTLKMTNDDFLKGNYSLAQDPNFKLSSVVNQGTITITDGGYAVLAAPLVSNEGLIVANLGKVVLGAGEKMTLNFDGRNILNFRVDKLTGAPGTVLIGKDQLSSLLSQVITHPNLIEAGSITNNSDGTVSLGGASGTLVQAGQISTNGLQGQKAGTVVLDSGQVTVVGPSALVEARGQGLNSAGGDVIVNSRGTTVTTPGSKLDTQGGISGNGGFIETSGKYAWLRGSVNPGKGGSYLIDPTDLTIVNGNGGTLDALLPNPTGGGSETISEIALESLPAGSNITLQADNDIVMETITDGAITLTTNTSLNLEATAGSFFADRNSDAIVASGTGQIRVTTGNSADLPSLTATNDIHILSGGDVRVYGPVISSAGTVNIVAGGQALTITGFSDGYVGGNNASINATSRIEGRLFGESTTPFYTRLNGQLSTMGSSTNIENLGNVTVGNVGNLAGMVSGPLCFVNNGNLVINSTINSTVDSILAVTGNVDITASGNIVAASTVSLEIGGNTTDAGVLTDAAIIAPNLVVNATGELGTVAAPLVTTVSNVAAQSTDGSVYLQNENSSNPLVLSSLFTLKNSALVTGVNAGVNASVQATNDIVVDSSIVAVGDAGLLSGNNITFTTGLVQAGNTAVVVARNLVGSGAVDVNASSAIIQGIQSVGTQASPFLTTVGNLAGGSFVGNFFVNNTAPTLNVADVTSDLFGTGTVTELEVRVGSGIICLENTGNIVVAAPIISSGNVALRSGGEISITTGRLEAVDTVSLESAGNILDDNTPSIDVNATNFVAVSNTGSVGISSDGLEVSAANLSVQAPGTVVVNSISGDMTVADLATLKGGTSLIGVTAGGDVALDASAGALNVNSTVNGPNIHLGSLNNTTIATALSTKGQIEVVAGNILDAGKGSLSASEIILVATSNVGSNANPLDISAQNLAGTSGGDFVVNQTGGLVVGNLTSFRSGTDFNGINAGGNVCIDVSPSGQGPSSLNISSPINATNSVALRVNANPVLSADIQAGALVSAGNTISAEAANGTIENTGAGNVNFQAANVVLTAQSVGAVNAIQTNATTLAAQSSIGRVSIVDRGTNVTVGNLSTLKGATAIGGVNSSSDVCLVGNNITVASSISASTNVALMSDNDTYLVTGSNISASDTLSLEAGGMVSSDVPNLLGSSYTRSSNLVIDATAGVGASGGSRLHVSAGNIAARSSSGSVRINDRFGSSVTVMNLTTLKGNQLLTGINAAGNIELSRTSGSGQTVLNSSVVAGNDANLVISNLTFNGGIVQAGNTAVILGGGGQVTSAPGNAIDINATSLAIQTFGNVGTAANPLQTSVTRLAGSAPTAYIRNDSPTLDLRGASLNLASGFNATFVGFDNAPPANTPGIFWLENTGSILSAPIWHSDVALRSTGGNIVQGNSGISGGITPSFGFSVANSVSLEAAGSIISGALPNELLIPLVNATNLVITAGNDIGSSAKPFSVAVGNFSARAGGSIAVNDRVGNLTITDLTTVNAGVLVSGVNAGGNVCVDASGGSLAVNSTVNGANVHLGALSNVSVNANVNATTQLEILASNGGISGGGVLQGQDLILASNTSIGSAASPFNVSAQNFAANSSSGDVYATASKSLTVANLTSFKSGNTYNGVSAAGSVCIDLPSGVLNVSGGISAGNTVALRAVDGIQAGGLVTAGNTISAESANGTIENTGAGNVNFQSANVVLAAQSIGASNAIQTNATNLASQSTNGTISVVDRGGNVTVSNLTTLKGAQAISGINSSSDVSLVGGNVTVNSTVRAVTNTALVAGGNLNFTNPGQIRAGDTVSLEAAGNVFKAVPGGDAIVSPNFVVNADGFVGASLVDYLAVSATNVAAQSTTDSVNLFNSNSTVVANLTTINGGTAISGLNAAVNVNLSTLGNTTLASNINAGGIAQVNGRNVNFVTGGITAGNLAIVVGADIVGTSTAAIDIAAPNVLIAGNRVGSQATPIETSTQNLAGQARVGDFVVRNSSAALNVTDVTGIGGINAAGNLLCLDSTGSIVVANAIRSGGNVALRSGGDILVSGTTLQAGNTVSLEATGNIQDSSNTNVDINATNFVAVSNTGSIGSSSDALEVTVANIAAQAAGSIAVNDTTGNLTVTDLTTLKGGTAVSGVNASGNVCIDASAGSLAVNSSVSGANVHLGALNDVAVNANANATTQLEVTATNGGISGGGQLRAQDLIMASSTSIGSSATPFNVSAQNFAANSSSGDVYATSSNSLTVANLTSFKSGNTYNGVSAAGNVCIDLPGGVLNVSGGISAGNTVALRALDGIQAGGLVTAGNTVSAESANGTIENTGAGNVNFQSASVVLAAQSIGASNAIQINATNLAAQSTNGRTSIVDRGGNVTVSNLTTLKSAQAITGINSSRDVCLVGNNITVASSINALTNVALVSNNDTYFLDGSKIAAPDTISLEAQGLVYGQNNGPLNPLPFTESTNFVVDANAGVSTFNQPFLLVSATNVAARSTNGSIALTNRNTSSNVVVTNLTTLKGNQAIAGINASGNVSLRSGGQGLLIDSVIQGGSDVVVSASSDIVFNNGSIQAGQSAVLFTGLNGPAKSVVSAPGTGIDVNATSLAILNPGGNVGSASNPLETSVVRLGGGATEAYIRNSSGSLDVTNVTYNLTNTPSGNFSVNGFDNVLGFGGSGVFSLENTGDILISGPIFHSDVALRSGGDIVLGAAGIRGGLTPTSFTVANNVSLEAGGSIVSNATDPNNLLVNAINLVATAGGNIGTSANALLVSADNIAARAGGSIVVNDTVGDLTVTDLTTLKGGTPVSSVNAGGNVCIDASAGNLNVNSAVSGANVHLGALNSVALNANTAATNQLEVLASNGGISGGGQLSSQELILASNSSIGPVQVQAQRLAANSASGDVNVVSNGPLELANLTSFKSGTAFNGVNAAGLVDIDSAGALNITGGVVAGGSVALRSSGDISFNGGVQAANTVSLEAGGSIVDNNAATLDVSATNLVATAGTDIGGNGNPLDVAVTNIATRSGGSTSVNAQSSNLAVTDLSTLKGNTTVSGVNATGNTSIQSSGGLSLNSNVAAGGDVHLQAGNTLAFAGGTVQTPNTAVLNATNIVSAPGNATDVNASNLLVIGNTGSPTDPLQTTASNFAGQSAAGNLVVTSSNANFVITNVTSALYTGTAVSGAQAADLICLEGAGAIQNAAPITAGNTVALRADNLIVSGALVSAGNLISVESPNGAVISNTFGQTNFQAPNVVLSAEDIGNLGPVAVNASNLAARATFGNVNLLSLSSNVNTANLTLVKSGTLVQGLTASNTVCLDASNGSIQINNPVSAGTDIALRSSGDLAINSTLTAANTVSLESGGSIRNQNAGVDVNAVNAVATAVGNVDLDLNVTNFAAQAANINATGVTNVASLNTIKGNTTVTGLNATTNVCVDAPGALNVNAAISGGNTVALRSAGNLNVNAAVNAGSKISAESTAGNIQSSSNITQFSANDVALRAGDIGSAQPLTVQAQRLAAQATTGNVQLNLTSTNTQTASLTLDKSGTLLQGVNANNGVCLDSLNGTLLVNNPITAGNLIALRAFNQIALNSTLTTNNTISLESGGSIRNFGGGVDANAANLVVTAGGNLDLDLNVTNFAAQATSVNVTGLVNTATLNTAKGNVTVVGVNATTFANLRGPGAVNINSAINAGDRVSLQSAGDINSNAATSAGNRISFESIGGSIVDGNGNLVNLSATDIVLRANLNIGGSDAIETQASRLAAQAQLGSLMIANTSPMLQVASLSLEGSENSISGLRAALTACLTQTGSLNVVSASSASELSMMAGGDIAIANNLTAANKLSLESTGGSIASTVNDTNAHLTAPNLVLSAQNNIASLANPLLVNTDNLAARAQTGNLGIVDLTPGLNITSQVLSCSNLNVQGVSAQNQLRVGALQGDMVVQNGSTIAAGSSVNITVANGNFFQNGTGTAIQSGGSAVVNTGCDFQVGNVGAPVAANVTGILTLITNNATTIGQPDDRLVVNTCMTPMAPMAPGVPPVNNTVNPPAQDNVFLGEIQEYYPMTGMMFGLVEERPRYPLSMLVLAVIESGKTNYQLENFFPNTLMEAKERQLEKPLTWGQGLDIPGQSTAFFVDPTQGYSYTQSVLENKVQLNWPTSLAAGSQSAFEQAVRDSLANDHLPSGIVENLIAQMREQNGPFMLMRVPALPGVENSPVLLMLMPYKP
jgi:trimeric autotransporter adhesin